jgi:hypothetical protein
MMMYVDMVRWGLGGLAFEWIEEKIIQCYFEMGSEFRTYLAKPPDMGGSI